MKRLALALFLACSSLYAQIGPISGGGGSVKSFTFQNANGITGSVTNPNSDVILSLQILNGAIALNQIQNISTATILGRKTAGTGSPELLAPSDVLDLIGVTRGSILYRGASGWAILAPGASGTVLTSQGSGADPHYVAGSGTVSTVSIGNLSPLFTASVSNPSSTPAISFTLSNAAAHTWFGNPTGSSAAPAFNASVVPAVMLGTGSDGSGTHALFDDGAYKSVAGGGSVIDVAVTTANGVSGVSDHNATTPHLTFTLGAITPSSIVASGTISGSNLSGTNTGDQTITLTGNVTGSGTGSFATTIAASAVQYSMIQNVAPTTLLGNPTGSPAAPLEVSLDGSLSFSGSTLRAFKASASLSAYAIDVSTTKSFRKTLTAGTNTFTWSNFNDGDTILVTAQQVPSGSVGTVVFPTLGADGSHTTYWPGGTQPTQTATFNKRDLYVFHNQNGDVFASTYGQSF